MIRLGIAVALAIPVLAQAPQAVGRLHYVTGPGRAVTLVVVDGGHKAFVTLRPEQGQAGQVRLFVLTHSGPEKLIVPSGQALKEAAPAAWRVSAKGDRRLLRTAEADYWGYTPGLVVPVRFKAAGVEWRLLSAEMPPRMLVSDGQ